MLGSLSFSSVSLHGSECCIVGSSGLRVPKQRRPAPPPTSSQLTFTRRRPSQGRISIDRQVLERWRQQEGSALCGAGKHCQLRRRESPSPPSSSLAHLLRRLSLPVSAPNASTTGAADDNDPPSVEEGRNREKERDRGGRRKERGCHSYIIFV